MKIVFLFGFGLKFTVIQGDIGEIFTPWPRDVSLLFDYHAFHGKITIQIMTFALLVYSASRYIYIPVTIAFPPPAHFFSSRYPHPAVRRLIFVFHRIGKKSVTRLQVRVPQYKNKRKKETRERATCSTHRKPRQGEMKRATDNYLAALVSALVKSNARATLAFAGERERASGSRATLWSKATFFSRCALWRLSVALSFFCGFRGCTGRDWNDCRTLMAIMSPLLFCC